MKDTECILLVSFMSHNTSICSDIYKRQTNVCEEPSNYYLISSLSLTILKVNVILIDYVHRLHHYESLCKSKLTWCCSILIVMLLKGSNKGVWIKWDEYHLDLSVTITSLYILANVWNELCWCGLRRVVVDYLPFGVDQEFCVVPWDLTDSSGFVGILLDLR